MKRSLAEVLVESMIRQLASGVNDTPPHLRSCELLARRSVGDIDQSNIRRDATRLKMAGCLRVAGPWYAVPNTAELDSSIAVDCQVRGFESDRMRCADRPREFARR